MKKITAKFKKASEITKIDGCVEFKLQYTDEEKLVFTQDMETLAKKEKILEMALSNDFDDCYEIYIAGFTHVVHKNWLKDISFKGQCKICGGEEILDDGKNPGRMF